MRTDEAIIFLGPGRSGTTSLYHSFKENGAYVLSEEKEAATFGASFSNNSIELSRMRRGGIVVDLTPSNLLAAEAVAENAAQLGFGRLIFVLIQRNAIDRLKSLYLHHIKLGNVDCSFAEYIERSHAVASKVTEPWDGVADLTYCGLCEYNPNLLAHFSGVELRIVRYDHLFADVNDLLREAGYPQISEIRRNRSYSPRWPRTDKIMLSIYRQLKLYNVGGLGKIKDFYIYLSAKKLGVQISKEVSDIVLQYERRWLERLSPLQPEFSQR